MHACILGAVFQGCLKSEPANMVVREIISEKTGMGVDKSCTWISWTCISRLVCSICGGEAGGVSNSERADGV